MRHRQKKKEGGRMDVTSELRTLPSPNASASLAPSVKVIFWKTHTEPANKGLYVVAISYVINDPS